MVRGIALTLATTALRRLAKPTSEYFNYRVLDQPALVGYTTLPPPYNLNSIASQALGIRQEINNTRKQFGKGRVMGPGVAATWERKTPKFIGRWPELYMLGTHSTTYTRLSYTLV